MSNWEVVAQKTNIELVSPSRSIANKPIKGFYWVKSPYNNNDISIDLKLKTSTPKENKSKNLAYILRSKNKYKLFNIVIIS